MAASQDFDPSLYLQLSRATEDIDVVDYYKRKGFKSIDEGTEQHLPLSLRGLPKYHQGSFKEMKLLHCKSHLVYSNIASDDLVDFFDKSKESGKGPIAVTEYSVFLTFPFNFNAHQLDLVSQDLYLLRKPSFFVSTHIKL